MADDMKKLHQWLNKELKKQQREEEKLARKRKKQLEFFMKQNESRVSSQSGRQHLFFTNDSKQYSNYSYGTSSISNDKSHVIVKTNFQLAGFSKDNKGVRLTGSRVMEKMNKSLNYIARDGASEDLEKSSNLYNSRGELLTKDESASLRDELQEMDLSGFRRIMISPNADLSREEISELVLRTMHDFSNQTEKSPEYLYAIHINTEKTHCHIIVMSEHHNELKWTKEDLGTFKDFSQQNTRDLLNERDTSLGKQLKEELEKSQQKEQEIYKIKEEKNEFTRNI